MANGNGKQQPQLPTFPARNMPPAMPKELHPEAQKAAAAWSDMMHSLEAARAENGQLKADFAVERRHVADLQRLLDIKTADASRYQRYAIEARTHSKHIIKAAEALVAMVLEADACALEFSQEVPAEAPPRNPTIEQAIAGVVAEDHGVAEAATGEKMDKADKSAIAVF